MKGDHKSGKGFKGDILRQGSLRQTQGEAGQEGCKGEKEAHELEKKLEECGKQKEEYLKGWQRERADFLNYKKEEVEKISEMVKYAEVSFIFKIISILDNFYLAEKQLPEELKGNDNVKGLMQIGKQLEDSLKKYGVEQIECLNHKFDPQFHEALEMVEAHEGDKEKKDSGIIIEEVKKGYLMDGKIIRPSQVKVVK